MRLGSILILSGLTCSMIPRIFLILDRSQVHMKVSWLLFLLVVDRVQVGEEVRLRELYSVYAILTAAGIGISVDL